MATTAEREAINHGHCKWTGTEWVPEYLTWCPGCRKALSVIDRGLHIDPTTGATVYTPQPRTIKVKVALSIELDPEAWRAEYGDPDLTVAEIRQAVRGSVADAAATDGIIVPAGIIVSVQQYGGER